MALVQLVVFYKENENKLGHILLTIIYFTHQRLMVRRSFADFRENDVYKDFCFVIKFNSLVNDKIFIYVV